MIEARGLTKRYGRTIAVDDLSISAEAGQGTGFPGPGGTGTSTTMRMTADSPASVDPSVCLPGQRGALTSP